MSRVVRIHEQGAPEVLRLEDLEVGQPGAGELRLRIEAIGLNRSEAAFRAGQYPVKPRFPTLMGYEAAGVVEALGAEVRDFKVGDRVCVLPIVSTRRIRRVRGIAPSCRRAVCSPRRPCSAPSKPHRSGCST